MTVAGTPVKLDGGEWGAKFNTSAPVGSTVFVLISTRWSRRWITPYKVIWRGPDGTALGVQNSDLDGQSTQERSRKRPNFKQQSHADTHRDAVDMGQRCSVCGGYT